MNDYNVPAKVNVPELMYKRFLEDMSYDTNSTSPRDTLLAKLASVTPTARGRGMSRWLRDDNTLTRGEWNALYELAADARTKMKGAEDREVTLRAAICARALAERMEDIGVDNPITYTPKFRTTRKSQKEETPPVTTDDTPTDLSSVIPTELPVVDQTADVEEAEDDDLDFIHGELASK